MDDDRRPVHVTADCATQQITFTPLTDEEVDRQRETERAAVAEERARIAEEQRLEELVAAHPDPLVRELARRAGIAAAGPVPL